MAENRQSFGFPLSVAVHSDVGRVRDNNEDSFGHAWMSDSGLFVIVADGMGGHEAGEVASSLAVQVMQDSVTATPSEDPRTRLYNACIEANEAILDEGRRSGTSGMGTTIISCVMQGAEMFICQVGDSRAYQIRNGHCIWRTQDHTRVQMLLEQGMITEEEARDHPESGMLTRALGHSRMADGRPLEPHVEAEAVVLEDMDCIIMSSDGLHDLVEDWEIARIVAGKQPDEASQELIEMACERGGHDNVTVAVITAGRRAADYDPNFAPPRPAYSDEPSEDDEAESTFDGFARDENGDVRGPGEVAAQPHPTEDTAVESGADNKKLLMAGAAAVVVIGGGLIALLLAVGGLYIMFG
jgi:PPM family protein phosphatase